MKTLLLDTSYPINSRNSKIVSSLQQKYPDWQIDVITWNRDNKDMQDKPENHIIYSKPSPYGSLFTKLKNLYGYYKFIKRHISAYDIIIASHWDMLLLASLLKLDKHILIYENLDLPTSYNTYVLGTLQRIERYALRKCDAIVFASRFYAPLYDRFPCDKFVIENKPSSHLLMDKGFKADPDRPFTVAFIGVVRYFNIMKNLVYAVSQMPSISLKIHGDGQDLLNLKAIASSYDNIQFTGRYEQEDLPRLYADADLIWAAYPSKNFNVRHAISNKFHESIDFHTPCLFSKDTKLGEFVEQNNIGITVNPYDVNDIMRALENLANNPEITSSLTTNLIAYSKKEKTWEEQFSALTDYLDKLR